MERRVEHARQDLIRLRGDEEESRHLQRAEHPYQVQQAPNHALREPQSQDQSGHWYKVRELGRGSFARVFRGFWWKPHGGIEFFCCIHPFDSLSMVANGHLDEGRHTARWMHGQRQTGKTHGPQDLTRPIQTNPLIFDFLPPRLQNADQINRTFIPDSAVSIQRMNIEQPDTPDLNVMPN